MTPNASYVPRHNFHSLNADDVAVDLVQGREYKAMAFSTLVDPETGEVVNLPLHMARNPNWYFTKVGEFNPKRPEVSQAEYVTAVVRGNEGLDAGELYKVMLGEAFAPYGGRPIPYNGFTTLLAKDPGIEMRQDGQVVSGTAATRGKVHGCTYHVKVKARRVDGWAA